MLIEQKKRASARGGRVTKFKGQVASIAPSLLLGSVSIIAVSAGPAVGDIINGAQTTPLISSVDEDHTITSTGSIDVNPLTGPGAVQINVSDYTSTLTNAGRVTSPEGNLRTRSGVDVNGDLSGVVLNSGTISMGAAIGDSADLRGVDIQGSVTGSVQNTGTIQIANSALTFATAYGISAADIGGEVSNSGTINLSIDTIETAKATGIRANTVTGAVRNNSVITMQMSATGSSVSGTAIELNGVAGTVENTGTIQVVGQNASFVNINGIEVGDLSGTLTNSGSISVSGSAVSAALAHGITTGNVGGSLSNSGSITVRSNATGGSADAFGIRTQSISGQLENSGSLSVTANGTTQALAQGISAPVVEGTLSNSGSMTITANGSTASADGITAFFAFGEVSNSGTIAVNANGSSSADAAGIEINRLDGQLSNSGTIAASAQGFSADATGISLIDAHGTLQNSGQITVSAQGQSSAVAMGISAILIDGEFSNSGSIVATAQATNGYSAYASGINTRIIGDTGSFANSGSITVTAKGDNVGYASAQGMQFTRIGGPVSNSGNISVTVEHNNGSSAIGAGVMAGIVESGSRFSNSGSVSVSVTGQNVAAAAATGIGFAVIEDTVENSGVLTVSAQGETAVRADGIFNGELRSNGTLNHSGAISVTANGADAEAYGLFVGTTQGVVNVTGDISAQSSGKAYAIFLGDGGGTLNIESTADINGLIRVSDHDVNLNNVGGRVVYHFEDEDVSAGSFTTSVSSPSLGWFVEGEGGAAPVYASFDAREIKPNTNQAFEIASLSYHLAEQLGRPASGAVTRDRTGSAENRGLIDGFRPYFLISGSRSDRDANSSSAGLSSNMWSASVGVTRDLGTGLRYGFGASYLENDGTFGTTSFDTSGAYLSAVVAQNFGFADLSFGLGYGHLDHDDTQVSNGVTSNADYSSDMITAFVGAQRDIVLGNGATLTPRASFLYGEQNLDGYTETGGTANATVGDRTVTFNETRIGGAYSMAAADGLISASIDAVHRDADAPSFVDVAIFGNSLSLASGGSGTDTFGEIGLNYEKDFGHGGTLRLNAKSTVGADVSTQALWASYEWQF